MKLKEGVDPRHICNELMVALFVADTIWKVHGEELVVTEIYAVDGHSDASLHYDGKAADLRTRYFHESEVPAIAGRLREALGDTRGRFYDVVVHKTHIHIEWQPKSRG